MLTIPMNGLSASATKPKVAIVGAGSVGCLAAIELAKQGWSVDMYEGRAGLLFVLCVFLSMLTDHRSSDMRLPEVLAATQQRSINLSISSRGVSALEAVLGQEEVDLMLVDSIPMRGRMIHDQKGKLHSQTYDRHGRVSPDFLSNRDTV
jgi:kynurenine 3-monooxygenase